MGPLLTYDLVAPVLVVLDRATTYPSHLSRYLLALALVTSLLARVRAPKAQHLATAVVMLVDVRTASSTSARTVCGRCDQRSRSRSRTDREADRPHFPPHLAWLILCLSRHYLAMLSVLVAWVIVTSTRMLQRGLPMVQSTRLPVRLALLMPLLHP